MTKIKLGAEHFRESGNKIYEYIHTYVCLNDMVSVCWELCVEVRNLYKINHSESMS